MPRPALLADRPSGRGLYCNRTLNMRSIKVIGYDMDYTLVHYRVEDWERRAYEHLRRRLAARGIPVEGLTFDHELVVRGLVIDSALGNLLKPNRFGYVKAAYHGTARMDYETMRATYGRVVVELADPRYLFLNTLFSLSEGCMYAQLVDRLDAGELGEAMGYEMLFRLVRDNVDAAHTEGELKAEIMARPEDFVERDEETVLTLLDQRHAGKRLALITNSEWHYTLAMMRHAFDGFLPGRMTWRDLFDVVVVSARKPAFFESDAPLLEVIDDEGRMRADVRRLEPHGCYFGGNAGFLERQLGLSGDQILYLGDHMFGDVHVSKRVLRWRTGLILRELEAELAAVEDSRDDQRLLATLMRKKESLEHEQCTVRLWLQRRKDDYGPSPDGQDSTSLDALSRRLSKLRHKIDALDERIGPLAARAGSIHNRRWGLLMRAGNDKSQLARQVERYADVYTSRVSNFLFTTPFAYLRAPRGSLPHDPLPTQPLGDEAEV